MRLRLSAQKIPTRHKSRGTKSTISRISARQISTKPFPSSTRPKTQWEVSIKKVYRR